MALWWALALAWPGPAAAATPALLAAIDRQTEDNPVAASLAVQQQLAQARQRGDQEAVFWLQLAEARVHGTREDRNAAANSLEAAAAALTGLPQPHTRHALWLELESINVDATSQFAPVLAQRMAALKPRLLALGDAALSCEYTSTDLWLLQDADSNDEAWQAAEALERCGFETGDTVAVADARTAFASLSSLMQPVTGAGAAAEHLRRALQALGDEPMRFRRSIIEWEFGQMLRRAKRPAEAMPHLQRSLAAAREINDSAGVASTNVTIAEVLLDLGRPAETLPLLKEAQALVEATDDGFRMAGVMELRIRALAALKRPEVLAEIERARRWDRASAQPSARAQLALALAAGYASAGQYANAYAEMGRAEAFTREGKGAARDGQVLRMQARYEGARRDAENAELRHRSESSQLQLQAQAAQQRSLWAAVVLLALVMAALLYFGSGVLARRRTLADLALRDELTGQPNRRAVQAYAQAQFEQTRQFGVPMCLAMIDLDHFKRVNDERGHAVGDAALCAFAAAASSVLRGQDRLGRWGGEEWLLVMPGTTLAELPLVFERLRTRFASTEVAGFDGPHGLTFSMGGAELQPATPHLQALIAEADRELYRAKREGRDALRHAA